jgi:hypothetical protein
MQTTNIVEQYRAISETSQFMLCEYFMDQLRNEKTQGNPAFYVLAKDLAARMFEIPFTEPTIIELPDGKQAVEGKFQLSHIVVPSGATAQDFKLSVVPKAKGQTEGTHNSGHYTQRIRLGPDQVAAGLITEDDLSNLINYAKQWALNGDNNYKTGSAAAKQRMWLTPKSPNTGYVTFTLTERGIEGQVPALDSFAWTPGDFHFIGQGIKAPGQPATAAAAVFVPGVSAAPTVNPTAAAATGGRAL